MPSMKVFSMVLSVLIVGSLYSQAVAQVADETPSQPIHGPITTLRETISTKKSNPSDLPPSSLSPKVSAETPPFRRQFGLGVTGIFAQGVLYTFAKDPWSYYHGGVQGDFLFQVHPRVTLELSGGVIFSDAVNQKGERLTESPVSLGLRVYVKNFSHYKKCFDWTPYVAFAPQLNILWNGTPTSDYVKTGGISFSTSPSSLYLGANLGVGVEFRIYEHFSLNADLRGFGQGPLDSAGTGVTLASRYGLRFALGIAGYF